MAPQTPVTVRVLLPHEADVLNNVAEGVFDYDLQPAFVAEFFADPRHHLAVALADGVVVGMASGVYYVHPDKPAELFINEVGVADDWQGRGIGRQLMGALLEHARKMGCAMAWVLTEEDNAAARALYARAGGMEERGVVLYAFPLPETE